MVFTKVTIVEDFRKKFINIYWQRIFFNIIFVFFFLISDWCEIIKKMEFQRISTFLKLVIVKNYEIKYFKNLWNFLKGKLRYCKIGQSVDKP